MRPGLPYPRTLSSFILPPSSFMQVPHETPSAGLPIPSNGTDQWVRHVRQNRRESPRKNRSRVAPICLVSLNSLKRFRQNRDLSLNDIPNDVDIQSKIFVRDDVTQAGGLAPGNFRVLFLETFRHMPRGFPNDFKTANNCQKCAAVILQVICLAHRLGEI